MGMGNWGRPTGPGHTEPWFGRAAEIADQVVGETVSSWLDGYRDRSYAARMTEISNRMHANDRTFVATSRPEPVAPKRSRWRDMTAPRDMDRGAMTRRWEERHGGHTGSDGVTTQKSGGWGEMLFGRKR
jgi:hypothetical protein